MANRSIDEVIASLNKIVEDCKTTGSRSGYFAVLYRRVTLRVKAGILAHEFEDNARMERLVALFANRYLDAYAQFQQNQPVTDSWRVAFEAADGRGLIILQHLLLGINAHINLDLGIAAVVAAAPEPLETIKNDFNDINRVLSELVAEVKMKMGRVSPAFGLLMPLAKRMDEKLIQFSIQTARDGAWQFAQNLNFGKDDAALISGRDQKIVVLGNALARPNWRLRWILNGIGRFESKSVAEQLKLLETG